MCVPRALDLNESRPQSLRLIEIINAQPENVRRLALETLASAHETQTDVIDTALDNPNGFIENLRETMEPAERSLAPPPVSTGEPHSREPVTPQGFDPQVFQGLPDAIRAELLSWLSSDPPPPPQEGPTDGAGSVPEAAHPAAETTSPSTPSQPAAGEQVVEEVSWPRIHEWLQSRTGPRPVVSCVWCQEEVVISEGDLQPDNGEREPAYQLPCSHIVGQRCLHNSLELHGVRITRCPFCRADIGDVYG
ncbi:hypothetical protein F5883DRAFT_517439 [Diaporthe sp. PMI_573]|nr:hypothetical protein F5883DRAFT_517439 [Diaporthaceae sp. PMI_573]